VGVVVVDIMCQVVAHRATDLLEDQVVVP